MPKITRKSSSDSSTTSSSDSSTTAEKKIHAESKKEAKQAISRIQNHIDKKEQIPHDAATALVKAIQKEVSSRDFSKNKNKSDSLCALTNNSGYNKYIIKNAEKQLPKIKSPEDNNKAKKLIKDAKKNIKQEKNNSPSKFEIVLKLAGLKKTLNDLITTDFKPSLKKISSQINKFPLCKNENTKDIFKNIQTLYTHNIESLASEKTDPAVEDLCDHFKSSNINLNDFYIFDDLIKIKHEIINKKNTKVIEYIQQVIKKEEQPEEIINELTEMEKLATELHKVYQELSSKEIFSTLQAVQNSIGAYRDKCAKVPSNRNPDNNQSLPIEKRNSLIAELNSMPDTGSSSNSTPPNSPLTQVIPNPVSTPKKQADFSFMG